MWHWMSAHWVEWLSSPSWWQSFAGVAQVLFAALIFWVTKKQVDINNRLLLSQIDAQLRFGIEGGDSGWSTSGNVSLANIGAVQIVDCTIRCGIAIWQIDGRQGLISPMLGADWSEARALSRIDPGQETLVDLRSIVDRAYAFLRERNYQNPQPIGLYLQLRVTYHRESDRKLYSHSGTWQMFDYESHYLLRDLSLDQPGQ